MASSNPNLVHRLFVEEYASLIGWLSRSFERDLAEDAAQFAFAQLVDGKMPEGHEAPAAWLRVVARNHALTLIAQKARLGDFTLDTDAAPLGMADETTDPVFTMAEINESLDLLKQLKPAEAKVLFMLANGWSYKEIAADLGQSYTWVNRYASEGRAHLRRLTEGRES